MLTIRRSKDRGLTDLGWLVSQHSFSFGDYQDPNYTGFGVLRVINEDRIQGGTGFSTHPHSNMEIISYVLSGALEHKDSMGNTSTIKPNEVQRMSAGTGVRHSEYNSLRDQETHFMQIWIFPNKKDYPPSYGQKSFEKEFEANHFVLVASQSGANQSIRLNQDANIYVSRNKIASEIPFKTHPLRKTWIQMIAGKIKMEGAELVAGDGAGLTDFENLVIQTNSGAEFLLFDLPY